MDRAADLRSDMKALGLHLAATIVALDDPETRVGGSDVAALARERRQVGALLAGLDGTFDQAGELRKDYDRLGEAVGLTGGAGAAAIVRERRLASALVETLEKPTEVPLVDQLTGNVVALAPARRARPKTARSSA